MTAAQLRFWRDPALKSKELEAMRRSNSEWDFMGRTFLALALAYTLTITKQLLIPLVLASFIGLALNPIVARPSGSLVNLTPARCSTSGNTSRSTNCA